MNIIMPATMQHYKYLEIRFKEEKRAQALLRNY
jgi:hypothetical protein